MIRIEITQKQVEQIILQYLQLRLGDINIKIEDINIEVKSKQNYKSEWERAEFRAVYQSHTAI